MAVCVTSGIKTSHLILLFTALSRLERSAATLKTLTQCNIFNTLLPVKNAQSRTVIGNSARFNCDGSPFIDPLRALAVFDVIYIFMYLVSE